MLAPSMHSTHQSAFQLQKTSPASSASPESVNAPCNLWLQHIRFQKSTLHQMFSCNIQAFGRHMHLYSHLAAPAEQDGFSLDAIGSAL